MNLSEVFNTSIPLNWTFSVNEYYSQFSIGKNLYGVSAIEEELNSLKTIRVDFHFMENGKISHSKTNFGLDSLKVLSIVTNGIKDKFGKYDVIYFLAKKTDSDKEFTSRVKLYSRIVDKLKVENNKIPVKKDMGNEYLFALCSSILAKDLLLDFI